MPWVYDNTTGQSNYEPDTPTTATPTTSASTAPTPVAMPPISSGTTYNIGAGPYTVPNGSIDLNDPNQLAATGLVASQTTAQPYKPIVTGTATPGGQTEEQSINSTLYNTAIDPHLNPQETFTYQGINANAPGNIQGSAPQVSNRYGTAAQATAGQAPNVLAPTATGYNVALADTAYGHVDPNATYQSTSMNAAQAQVDPNSTYNAAQMQAAQMQETPDMMVQNQFDQLMQDDQDKNGVPDWAQTSVTQSNQQAAAMGLGNSTMALNATSTAIYNAALPMAEMNAQTAYNIAATNTANVQAANMSNTAAVNASKQYNASVFANTQALNAQLLQQANATNAQYANNASQYDASVYAQMGLQNLLNQQQSYLSNQAAENAAMQFNVQSGLQNDQFFASLNSQINAQNADRSTAVSQFNAGQTNQLGEFYDNMNSQLDMFNAQNQLAVDQSNVQWQRTVNTANTAGINAANQANVQNLFNMSQTDQNLIWQQSRDEASWALTSAENSQNRLLSLTNSALNRETSMEIMSSQQQQAMFSSLGSLTASVLTPVVSSATTALTSSTPSSSSSGFDSSGNVTDAGDFGGGSDFAVT